MLYKVINILTSSMKHIQAILRLRAPLPLELALYAFILISGFILSGSSTLHQATETFKKIYMHTELFFLPP